MYSSTRPLQTKVVSFCRHFRITTWFVGVSVLLVTLGVSEGADPEGSDQEAERAAALVEQFGDPSFLKREQAFEALSGMGIAAEAALEKGAKSLNREIRYRSLRLLSTVRTRQFDAMLERFLNEPDSDEEYMLPGWRRFEERVADSMAARKLFVEMQRAEPALLRAMESDATQVAALIYPRAREIQQFAGRGVAVTLGDVAVLVFVGADPDIAINTTTYSYVSNLLHQPVVRTAMADGPNKPLMRKLMGQWVLKGDGSLVYQSLILAMQYGLNEGIDVARKTLTQPNQQPHYKQYAIMTVAKLGDTSHLPLMEKLLTDSTVLQQRRAGTTTISTQVRDLALASAVHLLKHPLKDVGFSAAARLDQQLIFNPQELGFSDDQKRRAVFDRWKEVKDEWKAQAIKNSQSEAQKPNEPQPPR